MLMPKPTIQRTERRSMPGARACTVRLQGVYGTRMETDSLAGRGQPRRFRDAHELHGQVALDGLDLRPLSHVVLPSPLVDGRLGGSQPILPAGTLRRPALSAP